MFELKSLGRGEDVVSGAGGRVNVASIRVQMEVKKESWVFAMIWEMVRAGLRVDR